MRNEPLYQLPVEEPGDIEGWSINADLGGDLLAVAIAAELARIDADYAALDALLAGLPGNVQAGRVAMVRAVFRSQLHPFYNGTVYRGQESVIFERPFDNPPAVVVIPNLTQFPGDIVEVSASSLTQGGFTAYMFADNPPATQYTSGWIACDRTQ